MAIIPAKKNFTVNRRADFALRLAFKDGNSNAINLTGSTVAVQVWDKPRKTKYADFGITYTNRSGGIIDIKLTDTQTATLRLEELEYDVLITDANGNKNYYLEGTLFISEGYTA
tara:strand:- start:717 stop:1058 length:342 start_codon:yes stop_codon:yes gene_type:complete